MEDSIIQKNIIIHIKIKSHELKEILNDLDMRDDYKEKNANTHNGLSSGYLEFLEYNAGNK